MPFDIRYSDKQRKTQREISDRLDELSRCYARHIVYIATTMDGKDCNLLLNTGTERNGTE